MTRSNSNSLFNDDEAASGPTSPWDMPTPRKQQSRAELVRSLLPGSDVPESYLEAFDKVARDGNGGRITLRGIHRTLTASKLDTDQQAKILSIVAPGGSDVAIGRNEFNVLLALIGLAQEDETISLDSVDERKRRMIPETFPALCLPSLSYRRRARECSGGLGVVDWPMAANQLIELLWVSINQG